MKRIYSQQQSQMDEWKQRGRDMESIHSPEMYSRRQNDPSINSNDPSINSNDPSQSVSAEYGVNAEGYPLEWESKDGSPLGPGVLEFLNAWFPAGRINSVVLEASHNGNEITEIKVFTDAYSRGQMNLRGEVSEPWFSNVASELKPLV